MTAVPPTSSAALAYLAALTPGLRAASLATVDGTVLDGDPALAASAHAQLRRHPVGESRAQPLADGAMAAARTATHVVAAEVGPAVPVAVLALDVLAAAHLAGATEAAATVPPA
jgi:hypothetical protein